MSSFDGYRVSTRIDAGNGFGTEAWFPFFRGVIDTLDFPTATHISPAARDALIS